MDNFAIIPMSLIILLAIRAFWIFAFFGFIQHILLKIIRRERLHDFIKFYNPLLRNVAWILFFTNTIYRLAKINPVVSLLVVGVLLALGWGVIRNFVQGTIFRFLNGDMTGQRLKVRKYSGVVKKMDDIGLKLSTKNGEIIQIPYSHITSRVVTKPGSAKRLKTGSILIPIQDKGIVEEKKAELKKQLLDLPWVISGSPVKIERMETKKGKQQLKITFATISTEYIDVIRRTFSA